ncbi:WD40/YVTN/BNR-like repeat-containing protein [Hyunsoonleella pacifica]|uniref:Oxidoreductase n=1 Tax=Hyunsoonleella pacifica TaxID=1080224 RepID=A0A4Q9FLY8_9FLAO|nr:oxidoreductase [Hyunsoonleella pacifica]TBN15422.1 oxidoreductase [Hyunsoonleella pacifica]GGD23962.1 hypothetical protein GCM10011368_27500 [Hyunsoonleella pacifica]
MRYFIVVLVLLVFVSCKKQEKRRDRISKVNIENIVEDSLLNVRALEVYGESFGCFATSAGEVGILNEHEGITDYEFLVQHKYDTIIPNFRAISATSEGGFVLGIESPALLFGVGIFDNQVVYKETHPKAFYDSMEFWNDQEGIAIGDAVDGCLSIIITRDRGEHWTKLSCDDIPKALENEGAFAASDTNIAIVGSHTWIATTAGRVYYSPNKAKTWKVYDTPIIKDKDTEGIYSITFYDELNGFAIGGDYTNPDDNSDNKIRTEDGGKTWELVAQHKNPGYRSCVQYVPNSNGMELVAVGFKGIDFSNDAGNTWQHLSDEGFYTVRFLNDSMAYAAGKGKISKLIFRK